MDAVAFAMLAGSSGADMAFTEGGWGQAEEDRRSPEEGQDGLKEVFMLVSVRLVKAVLAQLSSKGFSLGAKRKRTAFVSCLKRKVLPFRVPFQGTGSNLTASAPGGKISAIRVATF